MNPKKNISQKFMLPPIERLCWNPVLYIPKRRAGISARITMVMVLFRSIESLTCTPFLVTWSGTNRKVSKASNVE